MQKLQKTRNVSIVIFLLFALVTIVQFWHNLTLLLGRFIKLTYKIFLNSQRKESFETDSFERLIKIKKGYCCL